MIIALIVSLFLVVKIKVKQIDGLFVGNENGYALLRDDENNIHQIENLQANPLDRISVDIWTLQVGPISYEWVHSTIIKKAGEYGTFIQQMSLEEKLGQMMIIRTPDNTKQDLGFEPGGYLLFGNDVANKSEQEIKDMISELQGLSFGALILVDEEGGNVSRISKALHEKPYPSVQHLYQTGGWEAIQSNLMEKSQLLKSLGIHGNLNPVVDVCQNPEAFIYSRTLGLDAVETAKYAATAVEIQSEFGLISCLKHFPGYGDNLDTHTGISLDQRSLKEYQKRDFLPFVSGIEEGVEMIMVAHMIMEDVDAEKPASLSSSVHQLLREDLSFDGLVITDDLTMNAIDEYSSNPLVDAVLAGNDVLITTDPNVSIQPLVEAVQSGTVSLNQIDQSLIRIFEIKKRTGILEKNQ